MPVDESNISTSFLESNSLETSISQGATTLSKLSRHKKGKSPIIVNTNQLRKLSESSIDNRNVSMDDKKKSLLKRLNNVQKNDQTPNTVQLNIAAKKIQKRWHKHWRSIMSTSASVIANAWKSFVEQKRFNRMTQNGLWSMETANKVFSVLVLGHRIRKIMQAPSVIQWKSSMSDMRRVIHEIYGSNASRNQQDCSISPIDSINKLNHIIRTGRSSSLYNFILRSDATLVFNLIYEYNSIRTQLHDFVFAESSIVELPGMSYLDLSPAVRRYHLDKIRSQELSLKKLLLPSKGVRGTPVRSVSRGSSQQGSRDKSTPRSESSRSSRSPRSGSSPRSLASRNSLRDQINIIPFPSLGDENMNRNIDGDMKGDMKHFDDIDRGNSSNISSTCDISGDDSQSSPLLTLSMICAEKLMPAKKGGVEKDSLGNPLADRKPGLRVSLWLPSGVSSQPSNLKQYSRVQRDFKEVTLNPVWDSTIGLEMPCPRSILLQSVKTVNNDNIFMSSNPSIEDLNKLHNIWCNDLIQWWSYGQVKIHVVDTDRFNQDIFLGEVVVMLSSLLIPQRMQNDEVYASRGTYSLNKLQPTDRVSGSVTFGVTATLPSIGCLRIQLDSLGIPGLNDSHISGGGDPFNTSDLDVSMASSANTYLLEDSTFSSLRRTESPMVAKSRLQRLNSKMKRLVSSPDDSGASGLDISAIGMSDMSHDVSEFIDNTSSKSEVCKGSQVTRWDSLRTGSSSSGRYGLGNGGGSSTKSRPVVRQDSPMTTRPFTADSPTPPRGDKGDWSIISPITDGFQGKQRRSRLADINRCLEDISSMNSTADMLIRNMNLQLEARKESRSVSAKNTPSRGAGIGIGIGVGIAEELEPSTNDLSNVGVDDVNTVDTMKSEGDHNVVYEVDILVDGNRIDGNQFENTKRSQQNDQRHYRRKAPPPPTSARPNRSEDSSDNSLFEAYL